MRIGIHIGLYGSRSALFQLPISPFIELTCCNRVKEGYTMNFCGAFWDCLTCSQSTSLVISGQKYSIIRLLGDGGYAFVYLVRRENSQELFALKKIRCMFGGESVANAMKEVEACMKLKNTGKVVTCHDSLVVQEEDGSKTVYIVMPYYANGTLQDKINENVVSQSHFSEPKLLSYAKGIAEALMAIHGYHQLDISPTTSMTPALHNEDNQEHDRLLSHLELSELVPYAHRDIKPANIMFDDNNNVVLIDLGSCSAANITVSSRQKAVQLQDLAAEHCTLPYRAPELFNIRTGSRIDEKVDVWGFGCTLFCMMYGLNPFEREEQNSGGNINICIARGNFSFPREPIYSDELKSIVKRCLTVKAPERPSMETLTHEFHELIEASN